MRRWAGPFAFGKYPLREWRFCVGLAGLPVIDTTFADGAFDWGWRSCSSDAICASGLTELW